MEAENWSESVEDLVEGGEVDKAISLLESVISKLESGLHSPSDQLSSALFELAKLYSDKGFSFKADETRSRALLIKHRSSSTSSYPSELDCANKELEANHVPAKEASTWNGSLEDGYEGGSSELLDKDSPGPCCPNDDWEAIADRSPNELFSSKGLPEVSKLSLEDTKPHAPKRRGRGTFSYKKHGLYSDQDSDGLVFNDSDSETVHHSAEDADLETHINYGTRHVLVLADFPPSTQTIDLESLLENSKDQGVVIRWVNDTVALAVFRSPSYALEALNCIHYPFTVRVLEENDVLLNSIQMKDLEPPHRRPVTSARTAQRLIAQGMGVKLPSNFGSRELRKQEDARKSRIVTRQNMKDEAWGDDVN